jgi:hypothetical protein
MFEGLESRWDVEARRKTRWTVYRVWMGVALIWLVYLVVHFERAAR